MVYVKMVNSNFSSLPFVSQVVIFNKWKRRSLRWNMRSLLLKITYYSTSVVLKQFKGGLNRITHKIIT